MKRLLLFSAFTVFAVALFAGRAYALPTAYLGYEGQLTNSSDTALTGSYDITFKLYYVLSGGTAIWTETHTDLSVSSGYFAATLGSTTPFSNIDFRNPLYLGITVESDSEMSPRQLIHSSAYSQTASTTLSVYATTTQPTSASGGSVYYNATDGRAFIYDAVNSAWRRLGLWATTTTGAAYYNDGRVGVGTTSPGATFSVQGDELISGTSTVGNLVATSSLKILGTATSTGANGWDITGGCFAINGVCITGSSATDITFSTTSADYWKTVNNFFSTTSADYNFEIAVSATSSLPKLSTLAGLVTLGSSTATTTALGHFGITSNFLVSGFSSLTKFGATNGTSTTFQTSNLGVGTDYLTDITGTGLSIVGGVLNCATASPLTIGCLSTTDWTLFNNKVSSTSIDTSAELAALLTDESGSGAFILDSSNLPSKWATSTGSTTAIIPSGGDSISLGIGTSTPGSRLSVGGVANFSAATSSFYSSGGIDLAAGCFAINGTCLTAGGITASQIAQSKWATSTTDSSAIYSAEATKVGIGTSSPYAALSVVGASGVVADRYTATSTATSSDFQGLFATFATTTSLFSTTASTTNLYADTASLASSTIYSLNLLGSGTTTAFNGINLTNGCFSIRGTCVGGSSSSGAPSNSKWSTSTDNVSIYVNAATNVGIGTSSPYTTLAVSGSVILDSNSITFASSSATSLTINYGVSSTSTIPVTKWNAWSIATSTTALSIFSIDTIGPYASSSFAGNFVIDGGRLSHDASTGETSIVNLSTGPLNFEDGAGWVSWTNIAATSSATADNDVQAYTAQLGSNDVLTIYGQADGPSNGAIDTLRTIIGTTTATLMSSTNIPYNSLIVSNSALCVGNTSAGNCTEFAMKRGQIVGWGGGIFMASSTGIVGVGTTSPYATLSVVGASGVVADKYFATSTRATSTFMGGVEIGTSTAPKNWKLTVQGGVCITSGNTCPDVESPGGLTVDTADATPDADDIGEVFDVAERYLASEEVSAGEIVALDLEAEKSATVKRATEGDVLIGVMSTAPAIAFNGPSLTLGPDREATSTKPLVALVGRVPVKVNVEGGEIRKGDRISASSELGIGKKALPSEQSVGFALENWPNVDDPEDDTVLVYVKLSDTDTHRNSIETSGNSLSGDKGSRLDMSGWGINSEGELVVKRIRAKELCLGSTCITESDLKEILNNRSTETDGSLLPEPEVTPEPEPEVIPEPEQIEPIEEVASLPEPEELTETVEPIVE